MKTKALIVSLLFSLCGCTSIQKQLAEAVALAGSVGDVEYSHRGFWKDSDLVISVAPDNTRTLEYDIRAKTPGGPSLRIKVQNIPAATEDEE